MYEHHKKAIETITNKLKLRSDILGIIVGGSVAHGFANENSDIDLMIVLSDEDYAKALQSGEIGYYETESTPYEGGYVDAKFTSVDFIKKVGISGSEPARFAFKDAFVSYSKINGLDKLVKDAARYPLEEKNDKIEKFFAQFQAWKWYYSEGIKRNNKYLIDFSIANFTLFAGRLILAHNEALYPFHKWFLKVLEGVANKPDNLLNYMNNVLENKTEESVEILYSSIINYNKWSSTDKEWTTRFMLDSELNWMSGQVPIADL